MLVIYRLAAVALGLLAITCDRPWLSLYLITGVIYNAIKGWPDALK